MKFELDADRVLDHLKSHGVEQLYHANTVRTSCTFLREGALLSRGTLDERGLDQTDQYTDKDDIKYGLWYDIFLDTIDIHEELNRRNQYGPVLFVFDVGILSEEWLQPVWVTKENPANWNSSKSYSDRYYHSNELNKYDPVGSGCFGNHIVLRSVGGVLRLKPHLNRIILDDPDKVWPQSRSHSNPLGIFSMAIGALVNASRASGNLITKDIGFKNRRCSSKYAGIEDEELKKMFSP
jgi:hypothetical protein